MAIKDCVKRIIFSETDITKLESLRDSGLDEIRTALPDDFTQADKEEVTILINQRIEELAA